MDNAGTTAVRAHGVRGVDLLNAAILSMAGGDVTRSGGADVHPVYPWRRPTRDRAKVAAHDDRRMMLRITRSPERGSACGPACPFRQAVTGRRRPATHPPPDRPGDGNGFLSGARHRRVLATVDPGQALEELRRIGSEIVELGARGVG